MRKEIYTYGLVIILTIGLIFIISLLPFNIPKSSTNVCKKSTNERILRNMGIEMGCRRTLLKYRPKMSWETLYKECKSKELYY